MYKVFFNMLLFMWLFFFLSREERRVEIKEKRVVKVSNILLLYYL